MECGGRTERVFSRTNGTMVCMNYYYFFFNNSLKSFVKVLVRSPLMGLLKCLNSFQLLLVFSEITGQLFIFTCSKRGQLLAREKAKFGTEPNLGVTLRNALLLFAEHKFHSRLIPSNIKCDKFIHSHSCVVFLVQKLGKKETAGHWQQSGLVSDHNIILYYMDYVVIQGRSKSIL